jgi:hypothetical protein
LNRNTASEIGDPSRGFGLFVVRGCIEMCTDIIDGKGVENENIEEGL